MRLQTEIITPQKEVTEAQFDEMLGCLPPERMTTNAFLVGEPTDHKNGRPRFELYFSRDGKFYSGGLATIKEFEMFLIPSE